MCGKVNAWSWKQSVPYFKRFLLLFLTYIVSYNRRRRSCLQSKKISPFQFRRQAEFFIARGIRKNMNGVFQFGRANNVANVKEYRVERNTSSLNRLWLTFSSKKRRIAIPRVQFITRTYLPPLHFIFHHSTNAFVGGFSLIDRIYEWNVLYRIV